MFLVQRKRASLLVRVSAAAMCRVCVMEPGHGALSGQGAGATECRCCGDWPVPLPWGRFRCCHGQYPDQVWDATRCCWHLLRNKCVVSALSLSWVYAGVLFGDSANLDRQRDRLVDR